ncbi:MAG: hypothetical protein IJD04_03790 [Desulfovibrionaceae bacterium]|nr:hypothetical protein [Desulfovibrionaceae bacterium]
MLKVDAPIQKRQAVFAPCSDLSFPIAGSARREAQYPAYQDNPQHLKITNSNGVSPASKQINFAYRLPGPAAAGPPEKKRLNLKIIARTIGHIPSSLLRENNKFISCINL